MNWFVFAFISSITLSLREFAAKKTGKDMPSVFMSWGLSFFMFLVFFVLNGLFLNYHPMTLEFTGILIVSGIFDSLATILYFLAIKEGDLSKIIPMLCFIPVVQLFVTPVLVHENLSVTGISGVLVVVTGSYMLNMEAWGDVLSPLKRVFKNKNAMMMLAVALIWGVSSSFHKIGVNLTDALFWSVSEMGLISLLLFPFALRAGQGHFSFSTCKKIFWPGIFSTISVLSYYTAISLGPVAYVSSVRRLGVLFSMLIGILFLKEKFHGFNLAGGMIMIVGAGIISLYG